MSTRAIPAFDADPRPAFDQAAEEDRLTWRTLSDIDDTPPGELLLGMLEPDGPTLLYGAGGLGKGATCAWLGTECLRNGLRPLIYDAEGHPREWRRRMAGLGAPPEEIIYVQPHELPKELLGEPLHRVVPYLAQIVATAECRLLIIDSVLAAANLPEERMRSDARAPYQYVSALSELGIPSISIGHTSKGASEGDPYGSVAWVNAMRLTWLGTRAEGDGHRVRWTPRKRNERGHIASLLLSFSYDDTGRLQSVTRQDAERATRDWIRDSLADEPRTVEDLAEEMADLYDEPPSVAVAKAKDSIRQALGRMRRAGEAHKTSRKRGSPWALGAQPSRKGA